MFKIESYVTPIIMNHVDKYVKNIRPQDAQLSLWEGEALFQNLDLRLDVLENELNLPFELLSGHIHELNIRVPWTKITSEPIKVTINTIEFVLKLRNSKSEASGSSASSSPHNRKLKKGSADALVKRKSNAKQDDIPQQQSAYSAVVNKIINNIVINCHNIILKFLEEEVVVSLNVQLLSFGSADEDWKMSMVDVNPIKVITRKLITVSDLTICLDKRNAAGQIDVCQEPMLYRCTFECRILRKYNINTVATTSITRIGILTKSLDINVSSMQFPLIMRLITILSALKSEEDPETIDASSTEVLEEVHCPDAGSSYLSWAWNLLPAFSFEPFEKTEEPTTFETSTGHTVELGFYIEQLNFTLKNAEFITDSILGATKRIKYTPLVRFIFGGIYFERISLEEKNWSNLKAGITTICVEPLGPCRTDNTCRDTIIESSSFDVGRPYIDKSLFDASCVLAERGWGATNFDEYSDRISDDYLLFRGPLLAFDMVKYKQAKQNDDTPVSAAASRTHRVQYRILSSGVTFRYTESFQQVIDIIKDYIDSYDYPAYYAESNVETGKMHPPLMEDYDELMIYIPLQNYKFRFLNIAVQVYPKLEPTDLKTQSRVAKNQQHVVPHFLFFVEQVTGLLTTPLLPDTLVHTTCQLPEKPQDLLNACYNNFQFDVQRFYLTLSNKSSPFNKLVSIPKMFIYCGILIEPDLWEENEVPDYKFDVDCEEVIFEFSKRELVLMQRLAQCVRTYDDYLLWKIIRQAWRPTTYEDTIKMQNQCGQIRKSYLSYTNYSVWGLTIKSLLSEVICNRNACELPKYEIIRTTSVNNWLDFEAQFPRNPENDEYGANVVILLVENFYISFDPHLLDFLNYQEEFDKTLEKDKIFDTEDTNQPMQRSSVVVTPTLPSNLITAQLQPNQLTRRSSRNSLPAERSTRKISHPEETIHLSSERDEKVDLDTGSGLQLNIDADQSYRWWLQFIKNLVLKLDIGQAIITIFKSDENRTHKKEMYCLEIKSPKTLITSSNLDLLINSDIENKIVIPPSLYIQKDTFNFSFSFTGFTMRSGTENDLQDLISPIHTNIIIALTHKLEKYKATPTHSYNEVTDKVLAKSKSQTGNQQSKKGDNRPSTSSQGSQPEPKRPNSSFEDGSKAGIPISSSGSSNESNEKLSKLSKKVKMQESFLKKKVNLIDVIIINIHADTTPISVFVSNGKYKLIKGPMSLITSVWYSMQIIAVDPEDDVPIEPLQVITAAEDNASIKDFFELESNAASSVVSDASAPKYFTFAVFCQWTITKATLELKIVDQRKKHKGVLELEDLIFAVDKHSDFIKFTTKIGNLTFRYLEYIQNDWRKNESLRIKMLAEASSAPHLNFIYTIVTLKNYFKRIGAKQRRGDMNRSIAEIIISLQFTEIILDLSKLSKFLEPWQLISKDYIDYSKRRRKLKREMATQQFVTAMMLPMVHVDSKGFILYLPVEAAVPLCSTCIAKIENIKVTNYLENPLQRNPIRIDVWSKASSLGMLGMPGAYIEDRQYEITFNNISTATGNWNEIKTYMYEMVNSLNRSNPAFEWNNPDRKTSLEFSNFFTDFKFVIIFAPCVEYNNVVICGQAVEYNCASDFVSTCTTAQMHLLGCLLANVWDITSVIDKLCSNERPIEIPAQSVSDSTIRTFNEPNNVVRTTRSCTSMLNQNLRDKKRPTVYYDVNASSSTIFESIREDCEQVFNTDSGFLSCEQNSFTSCASLSRCKIRSNDHFSSLASNSSFLQERFLKKEYPEPSVFIEKRKHREAPIRQIPYNISLVAGICILKLFQSKRPNEIIKKEETKEPLLSLTLTQPSFMVSQSIFELTTQIYLFNINVNMGGGELEQTTMSKEKTGKTEEEELLNITQLNLNLFPYVLVETKLGRVNPTGIKPPIFRLKSHISKRLLKEVEIEFCKPIAFNIAEDRIERLCECIVIVYDACIENSCLKGPTVRKVVRDTKIKLMRKHCFDADRINFKLDEIKLKILNRDDYNCKIMLTNSKANIKFITRPEKAAAKISIGAFYLRTDNKIFLHPVNIRSSIDFVTEPWYRLPLVKSTAKFNVIQLDIGVYSLRCLSRVCEGYKRINTYLEILLDRLLKNRSYPNTRNDMTRESWLPIKCPALAHTETNKKHLEECYQDDLRAGAFQFVEIDTDSFLPLPYQIQIIKKNYGIICWRYPQPRKMINIHLFPVPMDVPNPINIKCRMEYFSETHQQFIEYMEFCLSETVSKELKLPEREVCANIWRVVIMQSVVSVNADCFDDVDDDEVRSINTIKSEDLMKAIAENRTGRAGESEFILSPKVLVGCMRIDTVFQSECVPRVELLVTFNSVIISFLNQPDENVQLPSLLKKFKLAKTTQISQAFMILSIDRTNVFLVLNSLHKFSLTSEMSFYIKCIDYGFLNMVYLLEECSLQNYFNLNKKKNSLTYSMILSKISVNFGPSILHTLLSAKHHWEDLLKSNKFGKPAFIPKCIVVNRTHGILSFGQTGTTERIPLKPRECYMYSFRSDYFNQELTFFLPDALSQIIEASPPVPINLKLEDATQLQYIRLGNKCLVIKSRKLSATQIYVLVKGQVEIFSMVKYDFNFEISADSTLYGEKRPGEYAVAKKSRATFFRSVQQNSVIAMRMKFVLAKGKLRSGDIPLKSNRYLPWLVKVPTQNKEFISFWVRILREDITELTSDTFKPQRLLITIWPVFEISSSLTIGITATEATTNQQLVLEAEGGHQALEAPATHLSEHDLNFFYDFSVADDSKYIFNLSLKSLNWNKFFWYDEQKWTIEAALNELAKASRPKWPVTDENEWRIQRLSLLSAPPTITFKCLPSREFGCALILEVIPWGLFINNSGTLVSVYDVGTQHLIHIDANCMEMMFTINGVFSLKVQSGQNWYESLPIYFDGAVNKSVEKYYILQENVPIEIVIIGCLDITIFVLKMIFESGRRIFIMSSKYCVTNFTKMKLCLMPFIMGQKETTTRRDIKYLDTQVKKRNIFPVQSLENCVGISLDSFSDINFRKVERSADAEFSCFLCIKICEDADISIPILLNAQFARKCFSISHEGESIPLVTTLIEKNGIFYLNIFDDHRPEMLLNNQTEIKFFVGQTKAPEHTKVSKIPSEYTGKHFKWFKILLPYSKAYYTPSIMSENFPEVESTVCNLTIAIYSDNYEKKGIKWSKPIRTDRTWESYLNVPNYGDIRVVVCDQHKVTRVTIYYIAQKLEFSVKDLRSRLSAPCEEDLPKLPDAGDSDDEYDDDSIESLMEPLIKEEPTPTPRCIHFRSDCGEKVRIRIRCIVKDISLSIKTDDKLQNYKKTTIMGLNVDDFFVAYNENDDQRQLNVIISNLQIDNQLFQSGKYDFPVVLCSQEIYVRNPLLPNINSLDVVYEDLRTKTKPMALFTINLYDDEFVIRSFVCSISPIRAYIEDSYLNHLLDALLECEPSNCVYQPNVEWERVLLKNDEILLPRDIALQAIYITDAMKLQSFRIQPLSVLLSVHTSVRLYIALDHSPLSFSAYEKNLIYTVPLRFGQSLGMHYLSGAIFGAGWVVGSLEILGSPSCLARSFSTGLRDFVSMPVQGLFRGPWGFVVGVTQGSASLLRNVTAGTVNSVTKLAASVARNLDRLTLDADHIERTEALRRSRPQGFTQGFSQGMTGLGISILGAVGGLARHTLEARSPVEVVTGVGKGLVGAFTKPISGAVELVALAGQGMLHTVGFNAMPQQRAPATDFNFTTEPSAFRIWKLLPGVLSSDQILFYQSVLLIVKDQLRNGYAFLTSAVFAIMESQWDKLTFVYPADKVELYVDEQDKTLIHVRKIKDGEEIDEHQVYVHQRIMNFLQTSTTSLHLNDHLTHDSLDDILMGTKDDDKEIYLDWSFHITEHMGEYLVQYLKIINNRKQ